MRTFYLAFLYASFYASGTFNIMNTLTVYGGGGGLVAKLCQTLVTPWTVACQAPPSMGFSRQEYWSGLPCPPPGDLPDPGIEPASLSFLALAGRFFTTCATWETHAIYIGSSKPGTLTGLLF